MTLVAKVSLICLFAQASLLAQAGVVPAGVVPEGLMTGYYTLVEAERSRDYKKMWSMLPTETQKRFPLRAYLKQTSSVRVSKTYRLLELKVTRVSEEDFAPGQWEIIACGRFRMGREIYELVGWTEGIREDGGWHYTNILFEMAVDGPPHKCDYRSAKAVTDSPQTAR